jgi:hypothetical protein
MLSTDRNISGVQSAGLPFGRLWTGENMRRGLQLRPDTTIVARRDRGSIPIASTYRRIELAPFNIQVNAIAPGWLETDMTAPVKTMPLYQEIITRTPAGRFGDPDECAGIAVFLASRASDFVTGTTICVDGGYSIR